MAKEQHNFQEDHDDHNELVLTPYWIIMKVEMSFFPDLTLTANLLFLVLYSFLVEGDDVKLEMDK